MPWLGALCYDPAGAQHPPAPLAPSPVPLVPPGSAVSVHRQWQPWRSPGTDAILHVLFSPSLFTDRQQCLPAHPDPLQTGGSCSWRRDAGGGFCDALRSPACGRPEEQSLVYPAVASPGETPRLNSARGRMEHSSLLAAAISVHVEVSSPFRGRRTDVRAAKGRNVARILQPANPGMFLSDSYFQCHILRWWCCGEDPRPVPPARAGACSTRCTCSVPGSAFISNGFALCLREKPLVKSASPAEISGVSGSPRLTKVLRKEPL